MHLNAFESFESENLSHSFAADVVQHSWELHRWQDGAAITSMCWWTHGATSPATASTRASRWRRHCLIFGRSLYFLERDFRIFNNWTFRDQHSGCFVRHVGAAYSLPSPFGIRHVCQASCEAENLAKARVFVPLPPLSVFNLSVSKSRHGVSVAVAVILLECCPPQGAQLFAVVVFAWFFHPVSHSLHEQGHAAWVNHAGRFCTGNMCWLRELDPIGSMRCKLVWNVPSNLPILAWVNRSDLPILMNLVSLSNQNLGPGDQSSRVHHFVAWSNSIPAIPFFAWLYVCFFLCLHFFTFQSGTNDYSFLSAKQKGHQTLTSNQFLYL